VAGGGHGAAARRLYMHVQRPYMRRGRRSGAASCGHAGTHGSGYGGCTAKTGKVDIYIGAPGSLHIRICV
jgi:hypothetical protein